jgi:hypothetical protein
MIWNFHHFSRWNIKFARNLSIFTNYPLTSQSFHNNNIPFNRIHHHFHLFQQIGYINSKTFVSFDNTTIFQVHGQEFFCLIPKSCNLLHNFKFWWTYSSNIVETHNLSLHLWYLDDLEPWVEANFEGAQVLFWNILILLFNYRWS